MKKIFIILTFFIIGCYPIYYIKGSSSSILKDNFSNETEDLTNVRAIGCILPLTGKYSIFGKRVLNSILLSAKIFKREGYTIELIVKDSKGNPDLAALYVDELSKNKRVIGIIGGLLSSTVELTVKEAEKRRIPIIVLSQKENIRNRREYTFRNCLTNSILIKKLVKYSIDKIGLERFVILYPDNPYGETIMKLFSNTVIEFGGNVIYVLSYTQEHTDFKEEINTLKAFKPKFDSIFIPDYYNRIAIIVPQMRFYGLDEIQLLGYVGWDSKNLIKLVGKNVEGTIFVDGLYKEDQKTKKFLEEYLSTYGEEAGIIEAQAYDSMEIIINILENNIIETRKELRKELSRIRNYPGITGFISSNTYGDMEREPFILKIEGGKIKKVE
jgi:ABC-type branched-subunit amino acid transport system substrate-binding protein